MVAAISFFLSAAPFCRPFSRFPLLNLLEQLFFLPKESREISRVSPSSVINLLSFSVFRWAVSRLSFFDEILPFLLRYCFFYFIQIQSVGASRASLNVGSELNDSTSIKRGLHLFSGY